MRHDFQRSLHDSAAASQSVVKDPIEGDSTAPCSTSPPRVLCSYQQHIAKYFDIVMKEGEELTLGEDQVSPLVVEESLSTLFPSSTPLSIGLYITSVPCFTQSDLYLLALQKICLAGHIRKMANQLHADAI